MGYKHVQVTLKQEEYEAIRAAAGYEPMASFIRRQALSRVPVGGGKVRKAGAEVPIEEEPPIPEKIEKLKRVIKQSLDRCEHGNDPSTCPYSVCRAKLR